MIIFKDWLLKQNKRFKSRGRKILMLVDNAGGHNISLDLKVELTHITLYYLPPNTTSELQTADAACFKAHYTNELTDYYVSQLEKDNISDLVVPDVKVCMYMICAAWRMVSEETIVNCWNKINILKFSSRDLNFFEKKRLLLPTIRNY